MVQATPISIGSVLRRSFSIWLGNLVPFTTLVALVYCPVILFTVVTATDLTPGDVDTQVGSWALVVIGAGFVLDLVASAVIISGVIQHMRGKPPGIIPCLVAGLGRLVPVLAVGLVAGALVTAAAALVALGQPTIGFVVIIPGLIVYLTYFVAVPIAVIERLGPAESLARSKALTDGHKVQIFGALVLLGILERIVTYVVQAIVAVDSSHVDAARAFLLATLGVSVLLGALGAVVTAVIYDDLRGAQGDARGDRPADAFE